MHEVDPQWKWELCKFNYYENIGIEDLTFAGNTQPGFLHHGNNGGDDNDYKPIGMMRLVNSWIRRVDFTNISEALSISSSANISAYDIEINGHRGHSAIRSGGSSRIFIGKVHDHSNGYIAIDENTTGTYLDNAGQFHGCGVSKQSMGTVIWNVTWGKTHASKRMPHNHGLLYSIAAMEHLSNYIRAVPKVSYPIIWTILPYGISTQLIQTVCLKVLSHGGTETGLVSYLLQS
ncbi:DUF4955 domain-containing protein [Bacteroides sp. BFG-637]|nr:DUF4955 domain-containing protein [Bacteroides sp. BFG-637]MCS3314544.1 DUF4955 domain-containing protein [Bacteroides sp. BFG-637]